jgi:quercetin dioxygenase-like cupin family protein
MPAIFHRDRSFITPYPGVQRMMVADREDGSGAISMLIGIVEPGAAILPHTHPVEEAFTILEGDARVLVGDETFEVRGGGATFVAPGNTVHGLRNIGDVPVKVLGAYPSVNVSATRVDREI